MAIERQTPDPAQEVEEFQDMTTTTDAEELDNALIEILSGLDEEGVQYQEDGSVILGDIKDDMGDVRLWRELSRSC
jgi:hypothetical protein